MTEVVIWTEEEYARLAKGIVYPGPLQAGLRLFGNPTQKKFNKETLLWE